MPYVLCLGASVTPPSLRAGPSFEWHSVRPSRYLSIYPSHVTSNPRPGVAFGDVPPCFLIAPLPAWCRHGKSGIPQPGSVEDRAAPAWDGGFRKRLIAPDAGSGYHPILLYRMPVRPATIVFRHGRIGANGWQAAGPVLAYFDVLAIPSRLNLLPTAGGPRQRLRKRHDNQGDAPP
jgi:hypothetical protein